MRLLNIPSPRGEIFDRNGKKLVINRPSFDILIFPREITDINKISIELSNILSIPIEDIKSKITKVVDINYYKPTVIAKNINRNQ
ncbi:MAG: hypothetical protein GTO02_07135, partial [Candidatus Dadabacteria bacterium]|nr:hypothetical protein [Candidatus Dadabacteria bacterium]NIQ14169.1 hypothetical protein [Candidatus Dadabacteria bacterium]